MLENNLFAFARKFPARIKESDRDAVHFRALIVDLAVTGWRMIRNQYKECFVEPGLFGCLFKELTQTDISVINAFADRVRSVFHLITPFFRNEIRVMGRKREQVCHKRRFHLGQLLCCPRVEIFIQDPPGFVKMLVVVILKATHIFLVAQLRSKTIETHGTVGSTVKEPRAVALLCQDVR
ncbi:hypothetical protein D3C86_1382190 [compost metagenome]